MVLSRDALSKGGREVGKKRMAMGVFCRNEGRARNGPGGGEAETAPANELRTFRTTTFSSLSLFLSERQLGRSARMEQDLEKVRGGAIGVCSSNVWRAARPDSSPRAISLLRLQERCACYFKVTWRGKETD